MLGSPRRQQLHRTKPIEQSRKRSPPALNKNSFAPADLSCGKNGSRPRLSAEKAVLVVQQSGASNREPVHFGRFLLCFALAACACLFAFCFLLLSLSFLPPLSPIVNFLPSESNQSSKFALSWLGSAMSTVNFRHLSRFANKAMIFCVDDENTRIRMPEQVPSPFLLSFVSWRPRLRYLPEMVHGLGAPRRLGEGFKQTRGVLRFPAGPFRKREFMDATVTSSIILAAGMGIRMAR